MIAQAQGPENRKIGTDAADTSRGGLMMEPAQAYETLNLHPSADGQMVADAYWRMVRQAQGEEDGAETRARIEQLNDAYTTLTPKAALRPAPAHALAATPASPREACGARNFFSMAVCMDRQCRQPQYRSHPECAEFVRYAEARRQSERAR
jgi:hypothetical protein